MKNDPNKLFEEAIDKLKEANQELFRPEEDVVTYRVCKNSQNAIENYLKGYLLQKGIDPSPYTTVNSLFNQCKIIDKKFESIDLSDFACISHNLDSRYCNEVEKVRNCFAAADNLDTFLRKEKIIN